jgi:photosystem II stability/assembly factor-like uncharacterized protein
MTRHGRKVITMKTLTFQTRSNSAIYLAPRKSFFSATVLRTLALFLFTASSLIAAGVPPLLQPATDTTGSFGGIAPLVDEWVRQSPLPTPRNLTGVVWATSTHGFASGESLTLIETFDGGATWSDVDLGTTSTDPLYNVDCVDANICIAIGNSGTGGPDIYRTSNAGVTWQRVTAFPVGGSWYHIDFVSPTVGFMGSNGATTRTTDGGATWTLMSGYPSCPVMYGMDFRDSLVGLTGGDRVSGPDSGPGIFKTTDAGVTWVRKFSQSANDVLWLNDTTAIAIVGTSIYRSIDSGETWSLISSQISTGLDEMTLLPSGTIVGVSLAGDGWRSTDGGFNWTRTLVGPGALPASWNVSFFDDQIGTIVGQGGFIFKTTDGGLTWTALNSGIGGVSFYDLKMFDDNTGLAVGDDGYVLRTTNGGNHWDTGRLQVTGVVLGRNENLQALSIVDQDFAVAAGYDGVVYKTFDSGITWESIGYPTLPGEFFISDVKFITHDLGYVTGNRPFIANNLFRTTDGGGSWTALPINAGQSVDFVDANHGWLMNVGGLGYRTTDGGNNWTQFLMPNQGFSPTILKIDFINQNVGWAVGWYGYAAHTTNGGVNWQLQNIATQSDVILGLHVLSESEVYAVGAPSGGSPSLYHTTDAGATWTKTPLANQYSLSGIFATASGNIWASGYDGAVLHKAGAAGTLQLLSAVSRKTHRTTGTFDVNLPLTGAAGVECRDGGGSYSFVFNFATNVVSGTASVTSGSGTAGTATFSGTTMTVPLSGVTDVQTITVTLNGVTDVSGQVLPATPVSAKMLIGDVNGDSTVNKTDVTLTKGQVGMPVTTSNFREDVKVSGTINSADVRSVKSAVGHSLL